MNEIIPIQWKDEKLILLDQTLLPNQIVYEEFETIEGVWDAIRVMKVRGAPAIGVSAAYGLYLGIKDASERDFSLFYQVLESKANYLASARPTAVNLFWAIDRLKQKAIDNKHLPVSEIKVLLRGEAKRIHKEDQEINRKIGENLLTRLQDQMGILTHCNAGALATTQYGTATAPMYLAKEKGWNLKIFSSETRPRLQGSMLTAFELQKAGIDVTVITDNMAAVIMAQKKVHAVIVGCDRVAANGDTANKIGTLGLSILAKHYGIPFYVAAPTPTIDLNTPTGVEIPIEEREPTEVTHRFGIPTAPKQVKVFNPSFDVTPHENITAIVTEKGILTPPYKDNIANLMEES